MSRVDESGPARQSSNELAGLLRKDREATASFVVALAQFDRDRHWVELGYNCLFNYVHRELRMSRSAAFFRTKAAELVQRFPEVEAPLRDGRLCITAVVHLAKVMNERNRAEILPRFFDQSIQAAREIVAELAPVLNPPRREIVTNLTTITHARTVGTASTPARLSPATERPSLLTSSSASCPPSSDSPREPSEGLSHLPISPGVPHDGSDRSDAGHDAIADAQGAVSRNGDVAPATPTASGRAEPSGPGNDPAAPLAPAAILDGWTRPLTADLQRLHVTVTRGFLVKLAAARDALAHFRTRRASSAPSGSIGRNAEVLEAGLDLILARDARNKGLARRPVAETRPCAPDHIPAHVRREVGNRDHWQCQYPLDSGGICGSRRNLQIDHVQPESRGGEAVPDNLRVLCAHHNALAARIALGDEVMDRYTRRARRR